MNVLGFDSSAGESSSLDANKNQESIADSASKDSVSIANEVLDTMVEDTAGSASNDSVLSTVDSDDSDDDVKDAESSIQDSFADVMAYWPKKAEKDEKMLEELTALGLKYYKRLTQKVNVFIITNEATELGDPSLSDKSKKPSIRRSLL